MIRDGIPRLIITDLNAIVSQLLTNVIASSIELGNQSEIIFAQNMLRSGIYDLKATAIRIRGELILPKSKGIGSVGEILHMIGSKNEEVHLEIIEDRFPGILGSTLKIMISKLLNRGSMVILVDDTLLTITAIIKNYDIHKSGLEDGIITISVVLEVLPILDQQSDIFNSLVSLTLTTLTSSINNKIGTWRTTTRNEFAFISKFIEDKVRSNEQ